MKTFFATALFAVTCFTSHAVSTISAPTVNPANQHIYYLLSSSTWTDAEAFGQTLGGHLVTLNNAAEDSWVYNTFSSYGGGDRTLWIGLNDAASEGHFVWANGESLTYTHWSPGEPNNFQGAEDYATIFNPSDSRASFWNDSDNLNTYRPDGFLVPAYGVIEVVPEPGAFALLGCGAIVLALSRRTARK
jgi:hypothetical protein